MPYERPRAMPRNIGTRRNQEERDLELALSLQEQEVEERRAWVVALAEGQYRQRFNLNKFLNLKEEEEC